MKIRAGQQLSRRGGECGVVVVVKVVTACPRPPAADLAECAAVLRSTQNDWTCKGVGLNQYLGSNTRMVGGCVLGVVCFKLGVR